MTLKNLAKEGFVSAVKMIAGEARVHDALIARGIKIWQLKEYYTESQCPSNNEPAQQTLIYMANGKWRHGGITDRLRGMTSAWGFAKEHGLDFKIFHPSPFSLDAILRPNLVDWIIAEKDILWDSSEAKPVLLYRDDFENIHALERQLDPSHKQFHLYSCVDSAGDKFPELFKELFTPTQLLSDELAKYAELSQGPYGAISFRMQNLLGDFPEGTFGELPTYSKKQELMDSALNTLDKTIRQHPEWNRVLVTADSPSLLAEATKYPKVTTVHGKSVHIDFSESSKEIDHLKAFVEFLLISKAQKAYLYSNRKFKTYPSNFPKYAAKLGKIPYQVIND